MFGSSGDNQATIKRKTKIKQKHKITDPSLLGNNPVLGPHMVQPGMTTGTTVIPGTKPRSSSSSSSSSNEAVQQPVLGTQPVEGLLGPTQTSTMMPGTTMGTGLTGQTYGTGYNQGMQYPNTGISGTGTMPMPVNAQGELPSTKTMAKNEAKVTMIQKVKDKLLHHGEK